MKVWLAKRVVKKEEVKLDEKMEKLQEIALESSVCSREEKFRRLELLMIYLLL